MKIYRVTGFTFIEILISLVIFSFILLGFDTMEMVALRENRKALDSTLATIEMQNMRERSSCSLKGVTLIEMLIAMTLSLIILVMLTAAYFSVEKTQQSQDVLIDIQENARMASERLNREIHAAGYMGCGVPAKVKITGSDHAFTLYKASSKHANLLQLSDDHSEILADDAIKFVPNEVILISDCMTSEKIKILSVDQQGDHYQKIYFATPLSKSYVKNTEIYHLQTTRYVIEEKNGQSGLYRIDNQSRKIEWVPHIKSMTLRYALNVNNKLIELNASQILDWSQIKAVAMTLTLIANNGLAQSIHLYIALREVNNAN